MGKIRSIGAAFEAGVKAVKSGVAKASRTGAKKTGAVAKSGAQFAVTNPLGVPKLKLRTQNVDEFVSSVGKELAQQRAKLLGDKTVQNIIAQQGTGTPRDVRMGDVDRILNFMGYKHARTKGDHFIFKKPGCPNFEYSGTRKSVDPKTIAQLETILRDMYGILPKK